MTETAKPAARAAQCGCGGLTVTANGEPMEVYACGCLNCQRENGGAFTYSAVFPDTAVSVTGEPKLWRRHNEAGRWLESAFCPTCGVTLFVRLESWPEIVCVSVGCFADPDFAKPEKIYWASRLHRWLVVPDGAEAFETQ